MSELCRRPVICYVYDVLKSNAELFKVRFSNCNKEIRIRGSSDKLRVQQASVDFAWMPSWTFHSPEKLGQERTWSKEGLE